MWGGADYALMTPFLSIEFSVTLTIGSFRLPKAPLTQCPRLLLHAWEEIEENKAKTKTTSPGKLDVPPHSQHQEFLPGWIVPQPLPGFSLPASNSNCIWRLLRALQFPAHPAVFSLLLHELPIKSQISSLFIVQMNFLLNVTAL